MNKVILVFIGSELYKQIEYKNKTIAAKQLRHFQKFGIPDISTGETIKNATFHLL